MSKFIATFSASALLAAQNAIAVELERTRNRLVEAIKGNDDGDIQFATNQYHAASSAFAALRDAELPASYDDNEG